MEIHLELDIKKVCRTCLKDEISVPLYLVDQKYELKPSEMFFKCNVEMLEKDELPNAICSDCYYKLEIAYQFNVQCSKSEEKFQNYLDRNNKQDQLKPASNEFANPTSSTNVNEEEIRAAMDELFGSNNQMFQLHQTSNEVITRNLADIVVANDLVNIDNLESILNEKNEKTPSPKKPNKISKKAKPIKRKSQLDDLLVKHKQKLKESNSKNIFKQKRKKKMVLLTEPEQCFECGKVFHYKGYLEVHLRTHNNYKPNECDICHKKFSQISNLVTHKRVHSKEQNYQCDKCSKLFSTSSNLHVHLKIHSGIKDFQCLSCPKTFKSHFELESHSGTHTGIKSKICQYCQKAFYKTSYLNAHIRSIHFKEKRYKCECGKEFSNSSNLICHKRIHSGVKPFPCTETGCTAKFNQSSSLTRHLRSHVKRAKRKASTIDPILFPELPEISKPQKIMEIVPKPTIFEENLEQPEMHHYEPPETIIANVPDSSSIVQVPQILNQEHHTHSTSQYMLPEALNPINLIGNNTSYTSLPPPPTSSLMLPYQEDHHSQMHTFSYENTASNYLSNPAMLSNNMNNINNINFIDFSKPPGPSAVGPSPMSSMMNQNFDYSKILPPPPIPTNNFMTSGLDFSKNNLNGQPTYIDY